MDTNEYLKKILEGQELAEDSPELKELREHRDDVEKLLTSAFPGTTPTIRYGGSKAKGTLVRESYDLDIACYFPHDDTSAGKTLKDIYGNVRAALEKSYLVQPRTSALRLKSKEANDLGRDFHIDVVPGRFVDDSETDCFLHQEGSSKGWLKTNLDVHIEHTRNSGVVPAIRLFKLWRVRRALTVRQFVFELLIIKVLKEKKANSLSYQLETIWKFLKDTAEPITVEDPANPTGNDLSTLLESGTWAELQQAATATLELIANSGWEAVFGPVPRGEDEEKPQKEHKKDPPPVVLPGPPPSRPRRDRDDRPPQPDRRHG
jgi:hypothetical protein